MNKKVSITTKPQPQAMPNVDEWINSRKGSEDEPMKRLTIDIPKSLHGRIKSQCALRGLKMADEIRELLDKHFKME